MRLQGASRRILGANLAPLVSMHILRSKASLQALSPYTLIKLAHLNLFRPLAEVDDVLGPTAAEQLTRDVSVILAFAVSSKSEELSAHLYHCANATRSRWGLEYVSGRVKYLLNAAPSTGEPITAINVSTTLLYTLLWDTKCHGPLISSHDAIYLCMRSFWRIYGDTMSKLTSTDRATRKTLRSIGNQVIGHIAL